MALGVRCTLDRDAARAVALLAVVLRLGVGRAGQARAAAENHERQHQRSEHRSPHRFSPAVATTAVRAVLWIDFRYSTSTRMRLRGSAANSQASTETTGTYSGCQVESATSRSTSSSGT